MPYITEWIDPELFLEYKDVKIYYTYKDNEAEQPRTYWYTWNFGHDEDESIYSDMFDVRELAKMINYGYAMDHRNPWKDEAIHQEIMIKAIDEGVLTQNGLVK